MTYFVKIDDGDYQEVDKRRYEWAKQVFSVVADIGTFLVVSSK